jgi:mannose-1-phosphate guanylyltransferase
MLHAVIMAGGSGTRFWPQSRTRMPKQLLRLHGDRTMIQQTADRCRNWASAQRTWVVTNSSQAAATAAQLNELPEHQILQEPAARNTAPCIGLAAIRILQHDPDGVMFVMPADHVIETTEQFEQAVRRAAELVTADENRLILFGVTPAFPSTGYGYIERGPLPDQGSPPCFSVSSFREKPAREIAEEYLRDGRFFWNCGIFCWKATTILDCLQRFEPELHAGLMRIQDALGTPDETQVLAAEFPALKSISIDYAVLERAENVGVLEAPFGWDDVGSWLSLPRLNGSDSNGNTIDGLFCGVDTSNCIVRTTDQHLVAALGVNNLIVVHTEDATLIADSSRSEQIREVLDALKNDNLQQFT